MQSHIEREKRWVRNNRKQTVEFRWHDGESLQTQLQNRYYENLMVKNHLIHTRRGSVCHEDESENGWDNIVRAYEDRM